MARSGRNFSAVAMLSPATSHRASCHRCGNMRKSTLGCKSCPSTWCARCAERLVMEYGVTLFDISCPVCSLMCCCSDDRSEKRCNRIYHCYKKVCILYAFACNKCDIPDKLTDNFFVTLSFFPPLFYKHSAQLVRMVDLQAQRIILHHLLRSLL